MNNERTTRNIKNQKSYIDKQNKGGNDEVTSLFIFNFLTRQRTRNILIF